MSTPHFFTVLKISFRKLFRYVSRYGLINSAKAFLAYNFIQVEKSQWWIQDASNLLTINLKNKNNQSEQKDQLVIPTSRHGAIHIPLKIKVSEINPAVDARGGDVGFIQYHLDVLTVEELSPVEKMEKLKQEDTFKDLLSDFDPAQATSESLLKVRDHLSDILWQIQAKTGIMPLSIEEQFPSSAKKPHSAIVLQHLSIRADFLIRVGRENYGTFECIDRMAKDSYDAWKIIGKTVPTWKSVLHQTHRFWTAYGLDENPSYLILAFEHDCRLKKLMHSLSELENSKHITDFLEFSKRAGSIFRLISDDFERMKMFAPENPLWEQKASYYIGLQREMKRQIRWGYWDMFEMKQVLEFGEYELRLSVQRTYPLESFSSDLRSVNAEMDSFLYERRVFNGEIISPSRSKIHLGNRLVKKAATPDEALRQKWS